MSGLTEKWNETYFNGRLSSAVLSQLATLEQSARHPEVRAFLERAFCHMQRARFPATAFTVELATQFGHVVQMVQDAWQGTVPPFTLEGRHHKLDNYLESHPWFQANPSGTFLDVGCGFPPLTTVATAGRFPNWQVIGIDPALPHYLVQEEHGDYALFDENGALQYFQGGHGRALAVWRDPVSAREHFTDLWRHWRPQLAAGSPEAAASVGNGRVRLVQNPVRHYERSNLVFRHGRIGALALPASHVIRCFNVLFYFDGPFRQQALAWFASLLVDGGLALCGVNGFHSTRCRYTVYRQQGADLVETEFAFSLDNVRPLGGISWSAFHDDDEEVSRLAALVGVIRSNASFQHDFDARLDVLLTEAGLFHYGHDGYLREMPTAMTPSEREKHQYDIGEQLDQEGYTTAAVAVLQQAGHQAWRNSAGHIAVRI